MTKAEIRDRLKNSRDWHRFNSDSVNWQDAFTLYNAVHGLSGKEAKTPSCGRCFQTVRDWLEV